VLLAEAEQTNQSVI